MPLFSEHISNMYYSGSPSYSSSPYSYSSSFNPLGTSYSASYLNPGGTYSTHSSIGGYSRAPLTSRWISGIGRNYSPMLTTISERGTASPVRINSPRRIPITNRTYTTSTYTPRPININTADIDVSRDKYRRKEAVRSASGPIPPIKRESPKSVVSERVVTSNEKDDNPFMPRVDGKPETGIDSSPGVQRNTIKRGRTVVRLHTVKRKERDSPRKPVESTQNQNDTQTNKNDTDATEVDNGLKEKEAMSWRERLSDDLVYNEKKEKKTLGAKLVEKFILRDVDESDNKNTIRIPREEVTQSLPVSPVITTPNLDMPTVSKLSERRCSMELLAEQASVLDSLIRGENLSTATLDLSKIGVEEAKTIEQLENKKRRKSNDKGNPLKTTKSDQSLHQNLNALQKSKDSAIQPKRRSLKKSSSGGSICRLDSITEFPKEISNLVLPVIEESRQSVTKETVDKKPKLKTKITAFVEVSPPTSPLKFKIENVTVEEKKHLPKKEISFSSSVDEPHVEEFTFQSPLRRTKERNSIKRKIKKVPSVDPISPEPDNGNFWDKIGKRETVYLMKRKQNIDDAKEKSKRALFWFPEDEESNIDETNESDALAKINTTSQNASTVDLLQESLEINKNGSQMDIVDGLKKETDASTNLKKDTTEKPLEKSPDTPCISKPSSKVLNTNEENVTENNNEIIPNSIVKKSKTNEKKEVLEPTIISKEQKIKSDTPILPKASEVKEILPKIADKPTTEIKIESKTSLEKPKSIEKDEAKTSLSNEIQSGQKTETKSSIIIKDEPKPEIIKKEEPKTPITIQTVQTVESELVKKIEIDSTVTKKEESLPKNGAKVPFMPKVEPETDKKMQPPSTSKLEKSSEKLESDKVITKPLKDKEPSAVKIEVVKTDNKLDEKTVASKDKSDPKTSALPPKPESEKEKAISKINKIEPKPKNEAITDTKIDLPPKPKDIVKKKIEKSISDKAIPSPKTETPKQKVNSAPKATSKKKATTEKQTGSNKVKVKKEKIGSNTENKTDSLKTPKSSIGKQETKSNKVNIDSEEKTNIAEVSKEITNDAKETKPKTTEEINNVAAPAAPVVIQSENIPKEDAIDKLAKTNDAANAHKLEAPIDKTGEERKAESKDTNEICQQKRQSVKAAPPPTLTSKKPIKEERAPKPLIATPRPLQKRAPQVIHSSESESSSEDETSSSEEESDSSEDSAEFYECENNTDGRTSTGSNDSGFDSSAPTSPATFMAIKKGGDSPGPSSSNASQLSPTDILEQELEQSTAYELFRKTGRFTPPARSIPRFRKYTIEDFQFIKVLGKGSFGKVLLAELRDTEYYYAVKCLKKDVVLEDDDVECTLIERKVLALGTNHPYLCHLFATFQTDSHLFFVMEYLNGGDLMFHIQQSGRFPEARARFYAAEIVSGLKFLHKRGIVYRDLKLDNILLDFEGHVRIADFGMCKLQIYLDKTADTFCGTPDYMAPEIIKGLKYNQTVDWWSFGVLLYEMLIGQSPFSGCDEDELFWSICNEMPSYPRFLSQESLTILTRLLDKDAKTRLGGVECMHGDVREQPFFHAVAWDRLERRELEAPFRPRVRHPLDTQYFDRAFTGERPRLTAVEPHVLRSMDQEPFRGFSYTNPNATDR